jgi:hypothetical protein
MTSDRRYHIYESGRIAEHDAIREMFDWDPKVPRDEARARKAYRDRNARVAEELEQLGLYPGGDINANLRTGGPPDDEGDGRAQPLG